MPLHTLEDLEKYMHSLIGKHELKQKHLENKDY
jgi:hypothetical protein